jgi:hypothetical protein
VFETFGDDIISLTAHGSVETTNGTTTEELRNYGVTREQQTTHRVAVDYQQLTGDGDPINPLTESAREEILTQIERILGTEECNVQPDLTVTSVTIRITDERLAEVTPAHTPEFDLTFRADPTEPPLRADTQRRNEDRGLYSELGFNITNLNLRSVVETAAKHHEQTNGRYLSWGGPEDIRPRSPTKLAVRINEHVLPDAYGILKPYTVADDSVLELADTEIDDEPLVGRGNGGDAQ